MITCMIARMSSDFGLIGQPTAELDALESLEKTKAYNGENDVSTLELGGV